MTFASHRPDHWQRRLVAGNSLPVGDPAARAVPDSDSESESESGCESRPGCRAAAGGGGRTVTPPGSS